MRSDFRDLHLYNLDDNPPEFISQFSNRHICCPVKLVLHIARCGSYGNPLNNSEKRMRLKNTKGVE